MVSYSVRLQVVICNWALSSWDSDRGRKWSTTQLLLHISCGCMDKMYFHTVTYTNVWSTGNLPMRTTWFSFLGCENGEKTHFSELSKLCQFTESSRAALVINHSKQQLGSHLHKTSQNACGLNFAMSGTVHKTVLPHEGSTVILIILLWVWLMSPFSASSAREDSPWLSFAISQ